MKLNPYVRIDSLAITLPRHAAHESESIYNAAAILFEKTLLFTGEREIATGRYRAAFRLPLRKFFQGFPK